MNTPPNHTLKIADTSADDQDLPPPESCSEAAARNVPPTLAAIPMGPLLVSVHDETKKRGRRRGVQRLSSEEIDAEIERVNRLNGNIKPGIAPGTWQDE